VKTDEITDRLAGYLSRERRRRVEVVRLRSVSCRAPRVEGTFDLHSVADGGVSSRTGASEATSSMSAGCTRRSAGSSLRSVMDAGIAPGLAFAPGAPAGPTRASPGFPTASASLWRTARRVVWSPVVRPSDTGIRGRSSCAGSSQVAWRATPAGRDPSRRRQRAEASRRVAGRPRMDSWAQHGRREPAHRRPSASRGHWPGRDGR